MTNKFGWLQASATTNYSAPISFEYPTTTRIDKQSSFLKCIAWSFCRQFPKPFISQPNESIRCQMVCSIIVYSSIVGTLRAELLRRKHP
jgi:hypothetical protein